MTGDQVLVTGASGFIGGWVVEAFRLEGDLQPIAGVRQWSRGARVARFGAPLRLLDVLDPASLRAAMDGCRYVVHAAVGDDRVTIDGTRNVADAALAAGVERIVHLSSVAVYGRAPGRYDEDAVPCGRLTPYGRRKAEAELVVRAAAVPSVVLRPTIVYGPYSDQWTTSFAHRLQAGTLGHLGEAGDGRCNLVYVSDVVDAVATALSAPAAVGRVFNVNGPDAITWNAYLAEFAAALGIDPLPVVDARRLRRRAQLMRPVRAVGASVLRRRRALLLRASRSSATLDRGLRSTEGALRLTPTAEQLDLFRRDVTYPTDAARDVLGLVSAVPTAAGVRLAAQWVRHEGFLEGAG